MKMKAQLFGCAFFYDPNSKALLLAASTDSTIVCSKFPLSKTFKEL